MRQRRNVFVDPRTMPPWLENVVGVNPITHLATAVRGLMHGTATAGQIGWVLLTSKNYTQILASSNRRAPSSVRRARKVSLSFFVF
jgi:hypothetical protein